MTTATDFQALLNVADIGASLAFYRRLGFEPVEQFAGDDGVPVWAQIKSGDAVFMLNRQTRIAVADRRARPDYGDAVFYITVPDSAETHRLLTDAGIDAPAPQVEMYGVLEFRLRDPDGYEIAIGSRVTEES